MLHDYTGTVTGFTMETIISWLGDLPGPVAAATPLFMLGAQAIVERFRSDGVVVIEDDAEDCTLQLNDQDMDSGEETESLRSPKVRRRTLSRVDGCVETEGPLAEGSTNPWWVLPLQRWVENGPPPSEVCCPLDGEEIVVHAFGQDTKTAHFPLLDQSFAYVNHGSYGQST